MIMALILRGSHTGECNQRVVRILKTAFTQMYQHMYWADGRILEALRQFEPKPDKPLHLFAHILSAEKVWLTRLNEQDSLQIPIWPLGQLEDCACLTVENQKGYQIFIEQLTDADLSKMISYRNTTGAHLQTKVSDILTHVSLHGSYHRGQIASYLRIAGYDPVNTDYITFVRE
jgi:uncharacterized damage-inducible protein DinB